jgi:DNA-binding NtrC family response regulator
MSYQPGIKLSEIEREAILEALRFHGGNRTLAAHDLGVSPRTMQSRVAQYIREGYEVPRPPSPRGKAQQPDPI